MIRTALTITLLAASITTQAKEVVFKSAGSTIILLDSTHAARLNSTPDNYTREHAPFDLAIRIGQSPAREEQYLQKAAADVSDWPEAEAQKLKAAFTSIDSLTRATGLKLHMPDTLMLIRTNGGEEFGAEGWTRNNRIMLNTEAQPISLGLVAHELWHVISRYNKDLRNDAYAVFHFKPCNNILYKHALHDRVITNPDCPFIENYITINAAGKPKDVALVLYSKKDFQPGYNMGDYANIALLVMTGDDQHKTPSMVGTEPEIIELTDAPDFFKQVGTNTQYMLHIEEVTAEHFAAVITSRKLPQVEYVEGLRKILMK